MGEILVAAAMAAVGVAVGSIVCLLVRLARMALLHVDRRREVIDQHGSAWLVAVPVAPRRLHTPLSRLAFGMGWDARRRRRWSGLRDEDIADNEMTHPRGLIDETGEFAGCVAPILLTLVAIGLVVLVVEVVAALVLAALVGAYRLVRSKWIVVVTDPRDRPATYPADSLHSARTLAAGLAADIAAGRHQGWNR